ncbi:S53 family peptidase [Alicyclobacillus dauci]|uniref:S8 family serine peptidase n=1 Tax=Alicyclobacillus dauci TaxID=1475485 RepID=A0ABY6Z5C0_9BACL|nr:S53 family peptidase [Alicyclobacillus dauci]WAH37220.1 S8 family serine peptidase [Alicyclobacillus dauci]
MKRKILFATETDVNQGQGYFPQDIRRLYNIPSNLTGTGQTIGILEFSNGYSMNDARQFWTEHNIGIPNVFFVSVDGTQNDNGRSADDEEASLDLQWAGAVAPQAKLVVYEATAGATFATFADALIATLKYILNDTKFQPSVLSISYGDAESSFDQNALVEISDLIAQLDAKGVTVCISSGDQGAYGMHDPRGLPVRHADAPASIPAAVAVGGTSLQPDGTETAWTYLGPQNGGATGGGFSDVFAKPTYQQSSQESGRGLPDVSLNADPATGYQIIFQGQRAVVGGTSVSCPVFAGIVALLNERREQLGKGPIRNLSRLLYTNASELSYKDITVGNNTFNGVKGFPAVTGWDACTGFGAIDAAKFIEALAQVDVQSAAPSNTESGAQAKGEPVGAMMRSQTSSMTTLPAPRSPDHPMVRVLAMIQQVEQDADVKGVHHHHFLIRDIHVLAIRGATANDIKSYAFVAIRYGDSEGLPGPIPNLTAGQEIELQGEYIPINDVYPSVGNPGDPVIHFTHHPDGYVIYQGKKYE